MYTQTEIISYFIVALASSVLLFNGIRLLDRKLRYTPVEVKLRLLTEKGVRDELSGFLRKQMVTGDADIRDGVVFAPVPAERLGPLGILLKDAASVREMLVNPEADSLYVRVNGEFHITGLDLSDISEAASVMSRVAEDRRKSRGIYKGMTEDEMRSLTRAGISQYYKNDSQPEKAYEVMQGVWDEGQTFKLVKAVLELAFKVKGASNA